MFYTANLFNQRNTAMKPTIKATLVPWQNPYNTNSLVAMWDAEWNVGNGHHDPNATVWRDLSGNGIDLAPTGPIEWSCEDGIYKVGGFAEKGSWFENSNISEYSRDAFLRGGNGASLEIVVAETSTSRWKGIFSIGPETPTSDNAFSMLRYYDAGRNTDRAYHPQGIQGNVSTRPRTACPPILSLHCRAIYGSRLEAFYNTVPGSEHTYGAGIVPFRMNRIAIGRCLWGNYGIWDGGIMSVRVYNRLLSPSEIAANYAIDMARFNLP